VAGAGESFVDVLVAFVAVEPGDSGQLTRAARAIRRQARRAGATTIVVNPFVHLTDDPAPPNDAADVGRQLVVRLRESADIPVEYTSFGWYKAFALDALGHENSQTFRVFRSDR
jgi:threonyl-tRNA synthetase